MMAPKLRFSPGLTAKAPGAVIACVPVATPLVKIFTGPSTEYKKQRWWRWAFFFFYLRGSFKCMIVILPMFWRSAPALKFSWQMTRNASLATMLVHSYRQSLNKDERSLWVWTSRSSFTAASRVVIFFIHQAPPSPVSSPSQSPPSFPSPSLSTRRNMLSPRSPSSRKPSNVQLVPACVTSAVYLGTSTMLFSAIWTKTARSIEELFSQRTRPKRASSDQWTDEEETSETCNNNHTGGRALTNAWKRNWGWTYIYVLGHRHAHFCDVYIRPVAVDGLSKFCLLLNAIKFWDRIKKSETPFCRQI